MPPQENYTFWIERISEEKRGLERRNMEENVGKKYPIISLSVKRDGVVIPSKLSTLSSTPTEEGGEYIFLFDRDGGLVDPVEVISLLFKVTDKILLVDLDGVERGRPQIELLQDASSLGDLWVDAGVSSVGDMMDILMAGASTVVWGSRAIRRWEDLEEGVSMTENLIFSFDIIAPDKTKPSECGRLFFPFLSSGRDGMEMGLELVAEKISHLGLSRVLVQDITGLWAENNCPYMLAERFEEVYIVSARQSGYKMGEEGEINDRGGIRDGGKTESVGVRNEMDGQHRNTLERVVFVEPFSSVFSSVFSNLDVYGEWKFGRG